MEITMLLMLLVLTLVPKAEFYVQSKKLII
jgi:hypothetical protein